MKIEFSKYTQSLSVALDYAEKAISDIKPFHGLRVAIITNIMAEYLELDKNEIYSLTQAAVLHDCALSEYVLDEILDDTRAVSEKYMSPHCKEGEKILSNLPNYDTVKGAILYHHENADGTGNFGLKASETPLTAQLIHLADMTDVVFSLYSLDSEKYEAIKDWVGSNAGILFSEECSEAFLKSVDYNLLQSITGDNAKAIFEETLPPRIIDISTEALRKLSSVFAEITDAKSHFTWKHSLGISKKAEAMGIYYDLSAEECDKLFISGALHDVGKFLISNDILEKPSKLSPEEYKEIQNHAMGTWELLHEISGMEDITRWAALHHEKLDGSGYPFKYTGDELDKNSRLMACLDIYQALVEERPYKAAMPHGKAMNILRDMGGSGHLDTQIIEDINLCFADDENNDYRPAEITPEITISGPAYRCPVCGYVHEGELPRDFICPRCEQPGTIFGRI